MQVFGLDSLTGAIVWQYLLPGMKPFRRKSVAAGYVDTQSAMPLFVQRTTAHFPHQPVCTVVGTDPVSLEADNMSQLSLHFMFHC